MTDQITSDPPIATLEDFLERAQHNFPLSEGERRIISIAFRTGWLYCYQTFKIRELQS